MRVALSLCNPAVIDGRLRTAGHGASDQIIQTAQPRGHLVKLQAERHHRVQLRSDRGGGGSICTVHCRAGVIRDCTCWWQAEYKFTEAQNTYGSNARHPRGCILPPLHHTHVARVSILQCTTLALSARSQPSHAFQLRIHMPKQHKDRSSSA